MNSIQDALTEALEHPVTEDPRPKSKHRRHKAIESVAQPRSVSGSDGLLWFALGSLGAAAALRMLGKSSAARVVGRFVPPLLAMGLYRTLRDAD